MEQLFSICEYYEVIDPNVCLLSELENDDSLKKKLRTQVLKLKEVKEVKQKQSTDLTDGDFVPNDIPVRFCFSENNKFICLSSKLSSGTHNIVLPEFIINQVNKLKTHLLFSDHVKLLTQACSMILTEETNHVILLPWYVLSTVQLLFVANIFGVDVSSSAFLQHESSLDNFVKPLCAKSELFLSKGYSMHDFNSTLFAFPCERIFQCSYVLHPENGSFTAIMSETPMNSNNDKWVFMDPNPCDGKLSRSLRSNSTQQKLIKVQKNKSSTKKVVVAGSTETFTATQLNSVISHFGLNLQMAGRKNLTLMTRQFFLSQFYQQQLIHSPLDLNIYCFDGQSNFVCMYQELNASEHDIVVTSKQKELYNFSTLVPNFDDMKKILLQHYLSQTNYVIELPWIALTRSQMLAITKDKCPHLNDQKVIACKNIPGMLSGTLKQSIEYKNHFSEASKFDSCLTFGISIEDPLVSCDWGMDVTVETRKKVAMYRELFKKSKNNQEKTFLVNSAHNVELSEVQRERKSNMLPNAVVTKDQQQHDTVLPSLQSENYANNQSTDSTQDETQQDSIPGIKNTQSFAAPEHGPDDTYSISETSDTDNTSSEESSYEDSLSDSEEIPNSGKPHVNYEKIDDPVNISENRSNDSKYNTCTDTPAIKVLNGPLDMKLRSNSDLSQVHASAEKSSMMYTSLDNLENMEVEDSEISLDSPCSFKSPHSHCQGLNIAVHKNTQPETRNHSKYIVEEAVNCSTPIRPDVQPKDSGYTATISGADVVNQFQDTSNESLPGVLSQFFTCVECKETSEGPDILECFVCCKQVHYYCYNQEKMGKPLPYSYYNVAQKHLFNHKWFCNECNVLSIDTVLTNMAASQLKATIDHGSVKQQVGSMASFSHDIKTNQICVDESNSRKVTSTIADIIQSNIEETEFSKSSLDTILSILHIIVKHQENLENNIAHIEEFKEHSRNRKWYSNSHKNAIKTIQANTEHLCKRLDSYELVKDINKEVCESKEILQQAKENISFACEYIQDSYSDGPTTYNQVKKSLFSSKVKSNTSALSEPSHTVNNSTPVRATVDPRKTVIISRDIDKTVAKGSDKIRSSFNSLFRDMKIKHCFVSKGGSIFIELDSEEDATSVQNAWKKEFFTNPNVNNAVTSCTLFAKIQNSIILKGVSPDITDDELTNMLSSKYPSAKTKRFIKRDGTRLTTVKVDFTDLQHKQSAMTDGITLGHTIISPENYIPKQRIIQCYNCFKYGHVAKLCHQNHPTCQICAGHHSQDDCHQQSTKCRNCLSTNHYATSKDCPVYNEALQMIKVSNMKHKANSLQFSTYDDI